MTMTADLASLFRRDLTRLGQQVEAFPQEELLWQAPPQFTNPPGNLVLHLEGNLREYVGRQLGNVPYARNRPLEFSVRGVPKQELLTRVAELRELIPPVIERLAPDQMERVYPEVVLEVPMSTAAFLLHLYGHLNWHLGQIDSLRRALTGGGAIRLVGL
jgi:DinB superfamily